MKAIAIHPTALIGSGVTFGTSVSIGAFTRVESGAVIATGCRISSHVVIEGGVSLGENVGVDSFSVLGGLPQDDSFDATLPTGVSIGSGTRLREGVTVHRATKSGTATVVGSDCLLMGASHVAHDAVLGNRVTLANGALIAGHVRVGDRAFVSGNTCVHQFCRIGDAAMVGAGCVITEDMPPYCVAAERNRLAGLNVVGLRRQGASAASVADIRACYRRIYLGACLNLAENAGAALTEGLGVTSEGRRFLDFFLNGGTRHRFCRPARHGGPA